MLRTVVVLAAVTAGASALLAQGDPINERKELMRTQARQLYGVINRMNRGQEPFDKAKADAAFAALSETTKKIDGLYPATSKPAAKTGDFDASPKIWDNRADFTAKVAGLDRAIAQARPKATDVPGLTTAYNEVNAACGACHELYRVRN